MADDSRLRPRFDVERRAIGAEDGPRLRITLGTARWLDVRVREGRVRIEGATGPAQLEDDDPTEALLRELPRMLDACAAADPGWKTETPPSEDDGVGRALHRAVAELRNPPRDLDAMTIEGLRARISEKWATYPPHILPLWVAEMDFPLAEPIRRVVAHASTQDDVGYPVGLRQSGVAEAFAARMDERCGWHVDPLRVEILSEVVQSMHVAMLAFSEPGDGALVQTPIYPPFLGVVRETGRRLVENRLVAERDHAIDFDSLRASADSGTRIAFLCNPHNPTGRAFRRNELEALAELAIERDWIVVMDEIHSDLVFDGAHIPFASLGDDVAARTVTLTSATKAFNIPGLRCSVAHFGTRELQRRFNEAVSRHARGGLGLLGLYATTAAWTWCDPWLEDVRRVLVRNRNRVAQFLAERLPKAKMTLPQATYLAWIDFSAYELGETPGRFFAREAEIALSDGPSFGSDLEGWARLNYATSGPILEEALERMAEAIDRRDD